MVTELSFLIFTIPLTLTLDWCKLPVLNLFRNLQAVVR